MSQPNEQLLIEKDMILDLVKRSKAGAYIYPPLIFIVGTFFHIFERHFWVTSSFLATSILLSIVRIYYSQQILKHSGKIELGRRLYFPIILGALNWSAFFQFILFNHGLDSSGVSTLMATAGIGGGLLASLPGVLWLLRLNLTILLVPGIFYFSLVGQEQNLAFALMSLIYWIYLIVQSKTLNSEIIKSLSHNRILENKNEELRQARDQALEASRVKSEFIANINHELRTPLNGILGISKLLGATPLTKEQSKYLDAIEACGGSLSSVISDVLDYSKIEAGKMDLEFQSVDLHRCIEESITVSTGAYHRPRIEILVDFPSEAPKWVRSDFNRLKQVIVNLLSNSLKFTQAGHIRISVSDHSTSNDWTKVQISVKDTGSGISKETQKTLFQPFTQGDTSSIRKHGGTGLGLVISKKLVTMLGGEIWYESQEGKGTQFYFTFNSQSGAPKSDDLLGEAKGERQSLSILVVEDNQVNQFLFEKLLQKMGHRVVLANDGEQALEFLGRHQFDLILMDIQMPGMNGYEATVEILKKFPNEYERPPIIALTASAMGDEREKCLSVGMVDYISKPVDYKRLQSTINSIKFPSSSANR